MGGEQERPAGTIDGQDGAVVYLRERKFYTNCRFIFGVNVTG